MWLCVYSLHLSLACLGATNFIFFFYARHKLYITFLPSTNIFFYLFVSTDDIRRSKKTSGARTTFIFCFFFQRWNDDDPYRVSLRTQGVESAHFCPWMRCFAFADDETRKARMTRAEAKLERALEVHADKGNSNPDKEFFFKHCCE